MITTSHGTRVQLRPTADDVLVILDYESPAVEAGRLVTFHQAGQTITGYQPPTRLPLALGPEVLRAIADLIERSEP